MWGLLVTDEDGEGGQDGHQPLGHILGHCWQGQAFLVFLRLLWVLEHVVSRGTHGQGLGDPALAEVKHGKQLHQHPLPVGGEHHGKVFASTGLLMVLLSI